MARITAAGSNGSVGITVDAATPLLTISKSNGGAPLKDIMGKSSVIAQKMTEKMVSGAVQSNARPYYNGPIRVFSFSFLAKRKAGFV